jgi:hypothetical protein
MRFGRTGARREQHPALDHRERLAGSDRRAAAEHVLQHRYRNLRLGLDESQARAPKGTGAADRCDKMVQAAAQESREEELRTLRGRHPTHLRYLPRVQGIRPVEDFLQREISFNRYFYKPQPLRPLEAIRADILALEKETEGLLARILGTAAASVSTRKSAVLSPEAFYEDTGLPK